MLRQEDAALLIIDVQGRLAQLMHGRDELFESLRKLARGARTLGLPLIWTEQNPAGLGPTIPELAELLDGEPIAKFSFSCLGEQRVASAVRQHGRSQMLLAGIEAHVCVCQTALDLLEGGYEVHVVADAVSSRTARNRQTGLDRMRAAGAVITSVEMALFELLGTAEDARFRDVLGIVK
jgi:nicotinamidase-related amidase